MYQNILSFKGDFRTYQQRILDRSKEYLENKRLHIVAAPGSGKTTLGIEIIRRLDKSCLILSPSITIRQQWLERIISGFLLDGVDSSKWLSNSLKTPKPITSITYQALHSCLQHYQGVLKEEDNVEEVDFKDVDLFEIIKQQNIKTLCLDEAHHLRNEWWTALEQVTKQFPDLTIIALTATPPYDSTPALWKRYIDLCGPIDEEISTPELIKEGSLCPHQDYVYFNYPTKEEIAVISEYQTGVNECVQTIQHYQPLIIALQTHQGLQQPHEYADEFLEKPEYLVAILIFLNHHGIPYPTYFDELLDVSPATLPKLNIDWLEKLLQGFLYDDKDAYIISDHDYTHILQTLKKYGCIQKKKVTLMRNDKISKMLISSKGKLNSIKEIVKEEYDSLHDDLRLLILCDYIKKETVSLVASDTPINEMGVIPIFEKIRREGIIGVKLGVLSGGIIIIPTACQEMLLDKLAIIKQTAVIVPLEKTTYSIVKHNVNNGDMVKIVTEIFQAGHINTLIGTKSLLGEGWDSPAINALILASFVGSFMLSNQMRGRAIRTIATQPNKVSNIWHLVCLDPPLDDKKIFKNDGTINTEKVGYDFKLLNRRFETFLGLHYQEDIVENGTERLCINKMPKKQSEVDKINNNMLKIAENRPKLQKRWKNTLKIIGNAFEIEEVNEVDREFLQPGYLFLNFLKLFVINSALLVVWLFSQISIRIGVGFKNWYFVIGSLIGTLLLILLIGCGMKLLPLLTPEKRLKNIGVAVLKTLQYMEMIQTRNCEVKTEQIRFYEGDTPLNEFAMHVYLKGATTREKTLFSVAINEIFDVIENPRYLAIATKEKKGINRYYAVPKIIGRKEASATFFIKQLKTIIGPSELVYTRTPKGRKILLEARTRSFGYKNLKILGKKAMKKIVKGKYQ